MATLTVNVVCARGLPSEWTESADPYCVVEYKGTQKKTRVDKDAGSNPNWNKTFEFDLRHPAGSLEIRVFDRDAGFDDFKGQTVIDLEEVVARGGTARGQFPLTGKQGSGNYGDIELEVVITTPSGWNSESAERVEALEKQEDGYERNQAIAGVAGLAAAGVAAYTGYQAATGKGNQTTNTAIAGVAGIAALAAGGYAASEHIKENKVEKEQESYGVRKHGWFD